MYEKFGNRLLEYKIFPSLFLSTDHKMVRDFQEMSPIHVACLKNRVGILKYLYNRDPNQLKLYAVRRDIPSIPVNPLYCAAIAGHLDLVKLLHNLDKDQIWDNPLLRFKISPEHLQIRQFIWNELCASHPQRRS